MKKNSIGEILLGFLIIGGNLAFGVGFLWYGYSKSSDVPLWKYLLFAFPLNIYALLFGIIFIYLVIYLIMDSVCKEHEEVLICKGINDGIIIFVDKNKRIIKKVRTNSDVVEVNKFYKVKIKRNRINTIMEETVGDFVFAGMKQSFWLTYYLPFNTYKDILLLPVVYAASLIFLPFIIPGIIAIFIVFYDLYTKYRVSKKEKELFREYPDYKYDDFINMENNIIGMDAPYFGKFLEVWNKYKSIITILIVVLVLVFWYFLVMHK